jgi:predicted nucleotidyltransferase
VAERVPASLVSALSDFVKWLEAARVPAMIIGGVAASVLGRPRMTRDVDAVALLPESDWLAALKTAAQYGIVPRVEDPLQFARRTRMLLLTHSASQIDIDLSLGGLVFEHEALDRSQVHDVGGVALRLPSVEDLLIMKAFAHRPKDMEDVSGLLDAHPDADLSMVRQWLQEFATATSRPDLLEDFEKAVARRTRKG